MIDNVRAKYPDGQQQGHRKLFGSQESKCVRFVISPVMRGHTLSFTLRVSSIAIAVALAGSVSGNAYAQDQSAQPDSTAQDAANANAILSTTAQPATPLPEKPAKRKKAKSGPVESTIEVTGSRLTNGDPTAQVQVITAEDIKSRGVTSVEELMRTIPQNLATIGAITNERSKGPLSANVRGKAAVSELGSLGVSAANLGGSGAGNTLVLVNGRRMAGAAGIEDGFVNLNSIPLSAIDRVEIDTSGSAAVYGADAMGGVINFILKKNYTGTTISAQHEFSANEASSTRVNIASGYAWGTGSLSGTASYDHRNPINNHKSGYTTQNYSDYYGGDTQYDLRSWSRGLEPGVISIPSYEIDPTTGYSVYVERAISVRSGLSGAPTMDDFVYLDNDQKRDYVPKYAGPQSDSFSFSANFDQKITNNLSFFANGLYNHSKSSQDQDYNVGLTVQLAPGQYYNPFPAYYFSQYTPGTTVYYFPETELASGQIPATKAVSTSDTWSVNTGLTWQMGKRTKLEFVFTTSSAKSSSHSTNLGSLVSFQADPSSPSGVSCYNFQLANNQVLAANRAAYQAAFDRQCTALTSSDPSVAFNPWGTGSGGSITDFIYRDDQEQRQSQVKNYELRLNGTLIDLPAGPLDYAVGGEYNDDGVNSREVNNFTGTAVSRSRYAFFGEMTVPILSGDFSLPLMRELTVNLALRNDTYLTDGAIGTVDGIPYDQGGELVFGHNRFSRYTPSFGVRWAPFHELAFRAKWSSGFRAPPYTQLFNVTGASQYQTIIFNDPAYTCTTDCVFGMQAYYVPQTTAPNPDLKPQTSTQQSFSASWAPGSFLQGLTVVATYNRTRIRNEYANRQQLLSVMSSTDTLLIEQFYPRDPTTNKITEARNLIFNIAGSKYESVNVEAHWRFDTGLGTFTPGVNYLRNLKSERQVFAGTPTISTLGKVSGVDRYKIMGQVDWQYKDFNATLWAYYTPPYINDYVTSMYAGVVANSELVRKVGSYTTFDLTGSWQMTKTLRLNIAGRNIFAANPPFVVIDSRPYDTARYNAAGRTFSIELQKSF
jgi:iron complex outermembrane receptor protein